jgi:hypothetical protein
MNEIPVHMAELKTMLTPEEMVDAAQYAAASGFTNKGMVELASVVYGYGPGPMAAIIPGHGLPADIFLQVVHQFAEELAAEAVVVAMEAWIAPANEGSASEHPLRQEVAIVQLEMRAGTRLWLAPVLRPDGKQPHLGAWGEVPGFPTGGGTLSNILTPRAEA